MRHLLAPGELTPQLSSALVRPEEVGPRGASGCSKAPRITVSQSSRRAGQTSDSKRSSCIWAVPTPSSVPWRMTDTRSALNHWTAILLNGQMWTPYMTLISLTKQRERFFSVCISTHFKLYSLFKRGNSCPYPDRVTCLQVRGSQSQRVTYSHGKITRSL